jgi:sirohydrochlorin cobaltochelatase
VLNIKGFAAKLAVLSPLGQFERVQNDRLSAAALVVLGHGTTLNDQSAAPVLQHAAELRRRKLFAGVREAFWKQEPQIKKVLAEITAPEVFIVPMFISEGYFSEQVIPAELGYSLTDDPASRVRREGARTVHYCRPVGSHDLMTTVILARAKEVVEQFPFPRAPKPADSTLFIAGHGTARNANSRKAVERQAELIRTLKVFAEVDAVFMEEEPFIKVVRRRQRRRMWSWCHFSSVMVCTRWRTSPCCWASRSGS